MNPLPAAPANLLGFARLLRSAGFQIAPEQAVTFMQAVTLLGPRSMNDIAQAARATLAPPPDRMAEFESLFRGWFWGDVDLVAQGDPDDETRVTEEGGVPVEQWDEPRQEKGGETASVSEQLSERRFAGDDAQLQRFGRALPAALPKRRSFRDVRAVTRGRPDLRRSLRAIVGADGDVPNPAMRRRAETQRRLVILIDVSGSMKMHTADHLKLAHEIVRRADHAEVFTLGTRLTRITSALRLRNRDQALARAASIVEDWDGGTRIGPTLLALLSIPRFAALTRGASIILLSDGLERGGHAEMEMALRRLSARAFRLSLCTPLAADPRFSPQTAALQAVLPHLDDLVDGSSIESVAGFILQLASPAPAAETIWRKVS